MNQLTKGDYSTISKDYNKAEINNKKRRLCQFQRYRNWKMNLFINTCAKEEMMTYLELNDNENTTCQNLQHTVTARLKEN